MGMADIGTELKHAREAAGLSRQALAERTHVQLAKITALEENAFDRLPEGPYLDGLVRAVSAAVGLDAAELWARTRNPVPEAGIGDQELGVGDEGPEPEVRPGESALAEAPLTAAPWAESERIEAPLFAQSQSPHETSPPRRFRPATFAMAIAALFVAFVLGFFFVRWTQPDRPALTDAAVPSSVAAGTDARRETDDRPEVVNDEAGAVARTAPAATTAPPETPAPTKAAAPPSKATDDEPAATASPAPPVPTAEARRASALPAADLSGVWTLATEVENSSYNSYEGLQLEYRVRLQQQGALLTGIGEKVRENGRATGGSARTPLAVQGSINGNRVTLTFTEAGTRRTSEGRFMLYVAEDGVLRGRFASDAAQSSGLVEARQIRDQEPWFSHVIPEH